MNPEKEVVIQMTDAELFLAATLGNMRRLKSKKLNDKKHSKDTDWGIDTIGAIAEMAVAKHLGVYWEPTVNTFKRPDVAGLQVRSSHLVDACLIVRRNDSDRDRFVLVIVCDNECRIAGWCPGDFAKADMYWRKDAWFVPQDDLLKLVRDNERQRISEASFADVS